MNFVAADIMPAMLNGCLFNSPEFHSLKDEQGKFYYFRNGDVAARISFYLDNECAISGYKAPFGSIDISSSLAEVQLAEFMTRCIDDLQKSGVNKIIIKQPSLFITHAATVESVLRDVGFDEDVVEINQHLEVSIADFSTVISQKERNKLNRAVLESYEFRLLGVENIPEVYGIITAAYERKGYPVTMRKNELEKALAGIDDSYIIFGLFDKEVLIAAVVSVKVQSDILYNFYHADNADYRSRSPLVMLIGKVYDYCFANGIKILDLGISSVDGRLNEGLYRFKKNLGCLESKKKTFVLEL